VRDPAERDHEAYVEQLQAIHALKDELELDDDAYRDLLQRLTGSRSAKFMTAEQRERVISFMSIHKALDEAVAYAEAARERLNTAYAVVPPEALYPKEIYLGEALQATLSASVEQIILMMREAHGPDIRLQHAEEEHREGQVVIRLNFG
jgi:hypothetical protein